MKCPKCNQEFSEPILPLHIARCEKEEGNKPKKIEQMNKEELLEKAQQLEIIIEDVEKTTKAQIIELIKAKETPQE